MENADRLLGELILSHVYKRVCPFCSKTIWEIIELIPISTSQEENKPLRRKKS